MLAFKRVVLLGVTARVILYFIPAKIRSKILNPYALAIAIFVDVFFQIPLATKGVQ
jgi:hypothetical protein